MESQGNNSNECCTWLIPSSFFHDEIIGDIFTIKWTITLYLSIMSEKLLWKCWWIMIINTAALMQLTQVCVLVILMTLIDLACWTRQEIPSANSAAKKASHTLKVSYDNGHWNCAVFHIVIQYRVNRIQDAIYWVPSSVSVE